MKSRSFISLKSFKEILKDVLIKFQGCLQEAIRVLHRSSKSVLRKFQGCFKAGSRKLQEDRRLL